MQLGKYIKTDEDTKHETKSSQQSIELIPALLRTVSSS